MEESILDFFVVCNKVLPYVKKMVIDEQKKYILTNYTRVRQDGKATDSDHFTQYLELELVIESTKNERGEIFDYKKKTKSRKIPRGHVQNH